MKMYVSPEAEAVMFTIDDIVTTSGGILDGDNSGQLGGMSIDEDIIQDVQEESPEVADEIVENLGGEVY